MGEVYRAEDSTLGRTVALKFLAAHLLHDAEAKQRFLREARAAAALHHPNICTVFEVAEEEGQTFLAMAYLEGESLEERIAKGPLPLTEALEIGRQIAEGLEAAHEKGVVHRDIKPANVMVDSKGRATILDFGLARLTEASKLTRADQTVGTMAYMSPEQIQGADVDHRTDVWALGCTLYEMVAGVRSFKGQYDQALAYEILNEEPEPLTGVRSGVPMELEFIVGKCLARDVADRYAHADEIARDLRTIAEKLKSGRSAVMRTAASPPQASLVHGAASSTPNWKRITPWAALTASLALALAVVSFLYFGQTQPEAPVAQFTVPLPEDSGPRPFSLSPDGRHLVMQTSSGRAALWVRSIDSVEPRELAGTEGATYPFWSPDSRLIGFFADGKLKTIPLAGGPALSLCDAEDGRGGSWSPDGIILFAPAAGSGIHRVSESGGEPVAVTSGGLRGGRFPQLLPDGSHFVYLEESNEGVQEGVYLGSMDEGEPRRLMGEVSNVLYVARYGGGNDGYLLFVREGTLMAQPFDADRLAFSGEVFPVAEQIGRVGHRGFYGLSASATGGLAYAHDSALHRSRQLTWLGRGGERLEAIGDPDSLLEVSLSPDDRRAAVTKVAAGGLDTDLWLVELGRKTFTRFTSLQERVSSPVWSPDGDTIAFSVGDHVRPKVYQKDARGGGEAERIAALEAVDGELRSWSPDGRWLSALRHAAGHDLWMLSPSGEDQSFAFLATEFEENQGHFSPDGNWVAYMSDKSGTNDVYLTPFPKAARERKISTAGGREPRWRGDGKELYFIAPDGTLMAVSVRVGETVELGSPLPLFKMDEFGGNFDYDAAKDGQRFLVLVPSGERSQATITVTTNWLAKARR